MAAFKTIKRLLNSRVVFVWQLQAARQHDGKTSHDMFSARIALTLVLCPAPRQKRIGLVSLAPSFFRKGGWDKVPAAFNPATERW